MKNLLYGKHWISLHVRIVAHLPTKQFFFLWIKKKSFYRDCPPNSLNMQIGLAWQERKRKEETILKIRSLVQNFKSNKNRDFQEVTGRQTDIATYRLNRPKGRFSESTDQRWTIHTSYLQVSILGLTHMSAPLSVNFPHI